MTAPLLVLAAGWVLVVAPPEPLPCDRPGWTVRQADGSEMAAVRMAALPGALGIEVVPVAPGRSFCDGFETP